MFIMGDYVGSSLVTNIMVSPSGDVDNGGDPRYV